MLAPQSSLGKFATTEKQPRLAPKHRDALLCLLVDKLAVVSVISRELKKKESVLLHCACAIWL